MPGDSGVTVVTTAGEHFYPFLPARLRAHRAPGIPCALSFEGRRFGQTSRENTRRDRGLISWRHSGFDASHRPGMTVLALFEI
jgi:hypothetical protein